MADLEKNIQKGTVLVPRNTTISQLIIIQRKFHKNLMFLKIIIKFFLISHDFAIEIFLDLAATNLPFLLLELFDA